MRTEQVRQAVPPVGFFSRYREQPMMEDQLRSLLEDVRTGATDVDAALERVRHLPYEDLGFAKVDHHRALRHGMPEVVFGLGKTSDHVIAIAGKLLEQADNVLITRTNPA